MTNEVKPKRTRAKKKLPLDHILDNVLYLTLEEKVKLVTALKNTIREEVSKVESEAKIATELAKDL